MRAFAKNFPNTSPREIVQMVTVNPARALNQEKALGKIRVGFFADLIALPIVDMKSVFEEAIAFVGPVSWSMVGGRIAA
jgi:imidazolonepropionase-like amidohydrolase